MPLETTADTGRQKKKATEKAKAKAKEKGKGKGLAKGDGKKGKGKGKGPQTGCWNCGGAHYASDCPTGKSKGKGKASPTYGLVEEEYDWDWTPPESASPVSEVRQLSSLRAVQRNQSMFKTVSNHWKRRKHNSSVSRRPLWGRSRIEKGWRWNQFQNRSCWTVLA